MDETSISRGIQIQESAVGSAIVSGDGNIIHVTYQTAPPSPVTPETAPQSLGPNPYQGLAAFTEQDGDRYFGREAQIQRLWQRFQDLAAQSTQANTVPRLLPILGPSGCGKSSLARAGLIPELARRPLPGKTSLRVVVLVPGSHPLEALAGVLAKTATQDPLPVSKTREFTAELCLVNTTGEYDGLRRIANLIPKIHDMPLVVLVDQFEEVYSLCKEEQERQAFIDNLLTAAQDSSGQVSVVITLRSDFLGETQRHPALSQVIGSDRSVIVPPMTVAELREAIARPAELAGHPLDEAAIDLLVQDTEGREGALPLLQFALTRIWEGLSVGKAPAETYRQMGGVGGALAGKAQELYDQLSEPEQAIARRIFLGLVQLGEGTRDTRRRATVESLIASQDSPEAVKQVLASFSSPGARLITLSSQGNQDVAEVTHEALFSHWQMLNDWLDSSRDDIRFQRRLEAAADYWHDQGRPAGLLWRFPDMDLLRTFVKTSQTNLNQRCLNFFHASDRAEQQQRRLKRLGIVSLAVGLVSTTSLSAFTGYQVWRAERRQIQIYKTEARNLAKVSPLSSMLNGLAAIGLGHNPLVKIDLGHNSPVKLHRFGGDGLASSAVLDLGNRHARFNRVVGGHEGGVSSVAMSLDGETIVSGGADGTMRLWDRSGQPLAQPLEGHEGGVTSVAMSADGETIVSGSQDGTVRLWDRSGQPLVQPLEGHEGGVTSVAMSANGETIVSGGQDGTVRLWNRSGQPLAQPLEGHDDGDLSVAMSADGETIVSGSQDGTVQLWDRSGQPLAQPLEGHDGWVTSVAMSADGETIVSGSEDGTVRLWDRSGQPLVQPLEGHDGGILSVAMSLDGETIVSGGADGTMRLWDRSGQPLVQPLEGHDSWVTSVAMSLDGETIVSGSADGTVRLWDRSGQPLVQPLEGHDSWVTSVAMSADGETIVSGVQDGTVQLWDRSGQPLAQPLEGHGGWVTSVAMSADGETIVSGGQDGTVRLWDRSGQPLVQPLEGHGGGSLSVAMSADGETIVSGGAAGTVRLWDRRGQPLAQPLEGHDDWVTSVAMSADGETIVSGGQDGTVRLWDRSGQSLAQPLEGHDGGVTSVAMSANGETIVSGSADGTMRLWNRSGQPLVQPLEGHDGGILSVAMSLDGETIVSGGADGTVRLWDRSGQPLAQPLEGHEGGVTSVAMSADGETIVSGGADGTVRLWPLWLAEVGWVRYTCNRIQGYLLSRSSSRETVRLARRTCERVAWR